MRTPIVRALSVLATALTVAACSGSTGSTGSPVASEATAAPTTTSAPTATVAVSAPSAATASVRPTPEIGRAGVLAPGTYRYSQRDPAVTLTVPTGWILTEAMPLHFGLRPTEFIADNSVRVWYDMRVASRDPSCPEAPDPEFGYNADSITYAFRRRPGVIPTRAMPTTLGGLKGHWFDLRVDPEWTEPCPFTDGTPATTLFTDDLVPDDPAFWGLGGYDERMRLIVLDDGAGSNVIVTIDAVDETTFDALVAAAMPVLDTFRFE